MAVSSPSNNWTFLPSRTTATTTPSATTTTTSTQNANSQTTTGQQQQQQVDVHNGVSHVPNIPHTGTSPPGNTPSVPFPPPPGPAVRLAPPVRISGPPRMPMGIGPHPMRHPFHIREVYKNGFLKRLPHNEKKSSALAKLLKSDRYWVVFSVHDEVSPFLGGKGKGLNTLNSAID